MTVPAIRSFLWSDAAETREPMVALAALAEAISQG